MRIRHCDVRHDPVDNDGSLPCSVPRGCASIVRTLAREIDARDFDPSFPATFPRFVQHAFWAFCAQEGLNICNGNRIDDSQACENVGCPVFESCARVPLRPERH
jgi:hypothetical protein